MRFFALLLSISLLFVTFSGCTETKVTDIWDGSIAEAFAGGDGSKKNPYTIEKASQLALLAQEVNAGTDYKEKYISLDCDLDLQNREWTPIGNGINSFNGIFDGNDHTISNLKITNGFEFTAKYPHGESAECTTGLFGSCYDATVKNITINKASVAIQNITVPTAVRVGVLIGTIHSDSSAEISNVTVTDADITGAFHLDNSFTSLRVGGIIGSLYGNNDSSIKMNNINSDTTVSIENGRAGYNLVGGIVGTALIYNLLDVNNCASYLSANIDTENSYTYYIYLGAFGSMTITNDNDFVSISNVFSKVTTNKIYDVFHGYPAYYANAIMGELNHGKQKDGTRIGGYKFQNLFGYVEQVDAATGKTAKTTRLYDASDVIYSETNCLGCESLPEDHGFKASVWDLTDLSKPKVKMK